MTQSNDGTDPTTYEKLTTTTAEKENLQPALNLKPKPTGIDRSKAVSVRSQFRTSNNRCISKESWDSDSEIVFEPDNLPAPMDSKINFDKHGLGDKKLPPNRAEPKTTHVQTTSTVIANESDVSHETAPHGNSSIDNLRIFSPRIPDFIRKLEPNVYNQIDKQSQPIPAKKKKNDAPGKVAESILKHTLNTNHLYFPGNCIFVSSK